ncbi:type VII secretion protein EccCa [Kineosporia succinea]|uniref:S-DNA-T family DNA segregation ATPase FtsK/SpoIIIE n=1 Tax=Kineosporia succinea TaxID=84632 RepID=A0ABT9P506_9ACTN|nr:type VII secretion protein EccCa [Kineosporia succinea]MDP9827769.1 S-DNA-T family DNA segregation ATPase FtsK/SpoIIIE [Kineosporia succinea]
MPHGEITLQEPPELPEVKPAGMRMLITVLPMMLMTGGMLLMYTNRGSGGSSGGGGMSYLMMGMMAAGMVGMAAGQMVTAGGDRKHQVGGDRRDYLRYLSQTRRQVRTFAEKQRSALAWRHPDPESLWSMAMTSRLWERRPAHPDFGELRVGYGPQRLAVRITPLQTKPVEDLEPIAAKALRRFIKAYTMIPDQPVALFVRGFAHIRVGSDEGTKEDARQMVRALIAQLVTFHAPDEVLVAVCTSKDAAPEWTWMKWLPHAQHESAVDAAGPVRLFGESLEDVERLLGQPFGERAKFESGATPSREEPFVVVINDGGRIPPGARFLASGYRNAVMIDLDGHAEAAGRGVLTLDVTATNVDMVKKDRVGREVRTRLCSPDGLSLNRARSLAKLLAPHSTRSGGSDQQVQDGLTADLDLPLLLGIDDLENYDPRPAWASRKPKDRLRVPIGVAADGSPIELDIKESAEDGMGPHGMLIGATGSGKSELLRTLVMGLAATHSSETLNFVLVDFKGGATFAGLDDLPHVSATITNLADEAALVDRMHDALSGELVRRQELLRAAGNYSSVRDYERARVKGAALDPLPTLFLVVDEFSELIATHGDFIDLFVMIGRLGRSLAVHLLLASQRLDDGRIHQLEGHLSYRIGLRTFSAMESRAVIGVPDAYELPSAPGNGYLRSDVATITRFKAAYVSGPHRLRSKKIRQEVIASQVLPYGVSYLPVAKPVEAEEEKPKSEDDGEGVAAPLQSSVMSVLASRLFEQGPPAHQVWLPPLEQPPTLDQVLPPLLPDPDHGLRPVESDPSQLLQVPIGLIDKPFEQIRDLLVVDLAGVGGHAGIAGGPQSGKSTLLRTLITGLALTHSPREVQFYCLDFGGGSLSAIGDLPHVGGVTGRHDPDRINRTIAEISTLLTERERQFAALDVAGMPAYRELLASGAVEDPFGDVFLVVDGWFTLRQEFEAAEEKVREIAGRGLNYGVHILLTASRWSEIHHTMRDKIGTKLELRLGDAVESGIDLRAAAQVPKQAGRGLTDSKLHFLGALPRIDGLSTAADLVQGTRHLVSSVVDSWSGPTVRPVRTLPMQLPVEDLPGVEGDIRIALGLDETHLKPVWHDFRAQPHLTVLGDTESGKTNLLRVVLKGILERYSPQEARIMAVDYRRELFDLIPEEYRLGYSVSLDTTKHTAADAVSGLKPRLPGPDITPDQLRRRDWWKGPLLFVLIDDYDLIAGMDNPLSEFVPLLPQAGDIGLHVVLTRAAAGLMRMSMDPVLRRMQELNTPDLALSCPPNEGPLLGNVKARHLPPGRAQLLTRRGGRLIQTAMAPALETADI